MAPTRAVVTWGLMLSGVAALGVASEVILARHLSALAVVAASAFVIQVGLTVAWNRVLRKKAVDLPTTADVWIFFSVAAGVVLVGLAVALRAAE